MTENIVFVVGVVCMATAFVILPVYYMIKGYNEIYP